MQTIHLINSIHFHALWIYIELFLLSYTNIEFQFQEEFKEEKPQGPLVMPSLVVWKKKRLSPPRQEEVKEDPDLYIEEVRGSDPNVTFLP